MDEELSDESRRLVEIGIEQARRGELVDGPDLADDDHGDPGDEHDANP